MVGVRGGVGGDHIGDTSVKRPAHGETTVLSSRQVQHPLPQQPAEPHISVSRENKLQESGSRWEIQNTHFQFKAV